MGIPSRVLGRLGRSPWLVAGGALYAMPRRRADTAWKDGEWYQVYVRSFRNARGNEWGDLGGVIEKLDEGYFESLGIGVIWLGPIFKSPQLDAGYDVEDLFSIDSRYGTIEDLVELLEKAHKRGIRVVLDLPLNHLSVRSALARAAIDPHHPQHKSALRCFLRSTDGKKYPDAPNPFKDTTENWTWFESIATHLMTTFFPHQVDLNYRNPRVVWMILRVMAFWFRLGVDGFRLDAIRHIYKAEGTDCQGLMETHVFVRWLRWWVDWFFPGKIFIGEANEPTEGMVRYLGTRRAPGLHGIFGFRKRMGLDASNLLRTAVPLRLANEEMRRALRRAPKDALVLELDDCHDDHTFEQDDALRGEVQREVARMDPQRLFNWGYVGRRYPLCGYSRRRWEAQSVDVHLCGKVALLGWGDEIAIGDKPSLPDRDGGRLLYAWSPYRYADFSADETGLAYPGLPDDYVAKNLLMQEDDPDSEVRWYRRLMALTNETKRLRSLTPDDVPNSDPERVGSYAHVGENQVLLVVRAYDEPRKKTVEFDLTRWMQWGVMDLAPTLHRRGAQPIPAPAGVLGRRLHIDDYMIVNIRREGSR